MSDDKKNPDDFSEEFGAEDDDEFSLPSFDEEDTSGARQFHFLWR